MKSKLLSAFLISLSFASADDGKPVNEALRDALYAEEVTRDNEAAAKQYEEVVSRYQAHREFAATALFRLAEVRRKQDRKEDAIKLYQQLITEFPSSEKQAALAKENLTELGGTIPSGATAPAVPESRNLERIRRLEKESPDQLDALKEFTDAIEGGYPGIIRHFIAKGVDPNATLPVNRYTNGGNRNTALAIAAADGSLSICELLLESGAKAGGKGFSNPLPDAVYYGRTAIVELFLKHGADPDDLTLAVEDPIAPFVGGALAVAIERGHLKIAELLIDRGANVNLVHPKTGLAPLHFALAAGHIDIAKKLLEKGADPDVECLQFQPRKNVPPSVGPRNPILPIGETPLLLAVSAGSIPLMETILPKSRKADLGKLLRRAAERNVPAMVKWLLEKGADPSPLSGENTQMIYRAVRSGNLETVKALLAAGANPSASMIGMDFDTDDLEKVLAGLPPQRTYTAMELTPLRAAVVLPEHALEMTKLLIDAGATPDDRWLKSLAGKPTEGTPPDPSKIPPAVGNLLAERFVIPKLNQEQTIHLLFTAPLLSKPVALTVEKSGTLPPGLPQLLLNSESIQWPAFTFSPHSAANFPERVEVWRTRAGSASIAWQGKLDQKGDFPVLFWGDVIRVGFDEGIAGHVTRHAADVSYQNQLPPKTYWHLRRKITIPVKVQLGGEIKEYQLKGGLVVFDPTIPELPMTGSIGIAKLLSPPDQLPAEIIISRKDWPDITLRSSERNALAFPLQPDDVIKLQPPDDEAASKHRKSGVTIVAKNHPAGRYFRSFKPDNRGKAAMPTLFQVLTDLLGSPPIPVSESDPEEKAFQWFHQLAVPQTIWLNPDFTNIRIRRLHPDEREEIITIDLAAHIARSSGDASFAEIRALDHQLQVGDIIEITLLGDRDGKWSGFTDKQEAFFAKALNGRVQVTDMQGKITLKELRYRALRYVNTPSGKLPFEKQTRGPGTSSFSPLNALGTKNIVQVRRGNETFTDDGTTIFLQHGDDIKETVYVNQPAK